MAKYVYFFGGGKADGDAKMKGLLGGKGANLAEMTRAGAPVPPGFTVTTEVCNLFQTGKLPAEVKKQMDEAMGKVEKLMGKKFGDSKNPLLFSVRSGAKFSMPGMMDTVLNLGLNDVSVLGLAEVSKNPRFAWDSYRRFIQMFCNVALGIDSSNFESELHKLKQRKKTKQDTDLTAEDLQDLVATYKKVVQQKIGKPFPQNPEEQLLISRDAVFKSWGNPRAVAYRRLNDIPHDLGTAVNIQCMVFGNTGENSGTGVGFTRNPSTGENEFYGEYLLNAQGEDVVAGIRTPRPIAHLEQDMPAAYKQLRQITARLEKHYKDVQDFEFTIEEGKLFMLQTRAGKRTGLAAVKIAYDMVNEKLITREEAVRRIEPNALDQLLHPIFDPSARLKAVAAAKGLPASPGAAAGHVVFTAEDAVAWTRQGKKVVLVRQETCPDDITGMHVSEGIITSTGGMTSHAAVVGRQMGTPCVVGCSAAVVSEHKKIVKIGSHTLNEGDSVSIDGATGEVFIGLIPTSPSEVVQVVEGKLKPEKSETYKMFDSILKWADKFRQIDIRTNADTPKDSATAVAFGAQGIGLCRTEHMFFNEGRIEHMRDMILADNEKDRRKALKKLLPYQRKDFEGIFKAMKGYPVTIRLLDPPLHEFLPKREELMVEVAVAEAKGKKDGLEAKKALLARVTELHEFNPMLGLRGCRLSLLMPEIIEMQARAIIEAACNVKKKGGKVSPEIMVPLTGTRKEMTQSRERIIDEAQKVLKEKGVKLDYLVGTMIEIPRAALTADEIAKDADFFSFGTNDLTQMTFGYSRDDTGKIIAHYLETDILEKDPFQALDQSGVGQLVEMGIQKGRATKPGLKVGICGEHGGDPSSVGFCHRVGMNYVSCSPFRVPIARMAAAQAALNNPRPAAEKAKKK